MYAKIDTDDEGDVTIRKVVEHIRAVEAGSGNTDWVEAITVRDVKIMFVVVWWIQRCFQAVMVLASYIAGCAVCLFYYY